MTTVHSTEAAFYLYKEGEQRGPFSEEQIRAGISDGFFSLYDLAWKEGLTEWIPLYSLISFVDVKPSKAASDKNPQIPPKSQPVSHKPKLVSLCANIWRILLAHKRITTAILILLFICTVQLQKAHDAKAVAQAEQQRMDSTLLFLNKLESYGNQGYQPPSTPVSQPIFQSSASSDMSKALQDLERRQIREMTPAQREDKANQRYLEQTGLYDR